MHGEIDAQTAPLHAYSVSAQRYDALYAPTAQPRPPWQHLLAALHELGPEQLCERQRTTRRLLRESGVTYHVYSDPQGNERPWPLDLIPLLIDSSEWAEIEAGLIQRAELFNLILQDLYGKRSLLRLGLLPPEVVLGHPGFLRPCDGTFNSPHALTLYAADLVRTADGQIWINADHTQAPSGAGYALENRVILSRVLPSLYRDSQVHRLAFFFQSLRTTLSRLARPMQREPRVVLLSPGPWNEAWFEHGYLANYLGYTLVQGEDLLVSDARVWLKTLQGLEPVDVILRRVDDSYCDPLELRPDSRLGVAGLVQAVREGNVAIANPLGSGILESPALLAFLPRLARHFLGQELRLPSVATWWCGEKTACHYVLSHLRELVVYALERYDAALHAIYPAKLNQANYRQLIARIKHNPAGFAAQEILPLAALPTLNEAGHLEPRQGLLRAFLCAREDDYVVMPGGLTRVAGQPDSAQVSNQQGGISKDTWVLASEPEKQHSPQSPRHSPASAGHYTPLPGRVAENLFWLGRYAERGEATPRLLRVIFKRRRLALESATTYDQGALECLLQALTHVTTTYPGFIPPDNASFSAPEAELADLVFNVQRPGTVSFTLNALIRSAYALRDRISSDSWRVLADLREQLKSLEQTHTQDLEQLRASLDQLLTRLLALAGLAQENTPHTLEWAFLDAGRRLERGWLLCALLRATLINLRSTETITEATSLADSDPTEMLLLEAILEYTDSLSAYRTTHQKTTPEVCRVLDLILLDERNPRSLLFQLERLEQHAKTMPHHHPGPRLTAVEHPLIEARTALRLADIAKLACADRESAQRHALDQLLAYQQDRLTQAALALFETYFAFGHSQHRLA